MSRYLVFLPLLAFSADLVPLPRPSQTTLTWQPGFESSTQPASYLREASLAIEPNLFRYSSYGAEFRFRNANPNPTFHYGPALPIPLTHYPSNRRIERYRSVRLANLYPNIDSTFALSPTGELTWTLSCTQSPCDWSAIVIDIPLSNNINLFANTLNVPLGPSRTDPRIILGAPSAGAYRILSPNSFGLENANANTIAISLTPLLVAPFNSLHTSIQPDGSRILAFNMPDLQGATPPYPNQRLRGCFASITPLPCHDVAVARFSPQGQLLWATLLSGARAEQINTLALAPDATIYLGGSTNSPNLATTSNAFQTRFAGPDTSDMPSSADPALGDHFIARFDPQNGSLLASTYLGGPNDDNTRFTLEIGADGSPFLLPNLFGARVTAVPTTPNALQPSCPSPCPSQWVARLSPDLSRLLFGTYLPEFSTAVRLHSDQSLFFTGASNTLPTSPNAAIPRTTARVSAYLARLDPSGQRLLSATYLDPEWSSAYALAVAPNGEAWVPINRSEPTSFHTLLVAADGSRILTTTSVGTETLSTDASGNLHAVNGGFDGVRNCGLRYVVYNRAGEKRFELPIPGATTFRFVNDFFPTLNLNDIPHRLDQNAPEPVLITCATSPTNFRALDVIAPGMILTLFGQRMGATGTRVFLNGWEAPVLYNSPNQLNIQAPWELETNGPVDFEVQASGGNSRFFRLNRVDRAAPEIFPVLLNQDGTPNSPENPAALGSVMSLWATGLGNTNPPASTGEIFPLEPRPLATTLQLRAVPSPLLEVLYAGAAPGFISGLNQINFRLPTAFTPLSGRPLTEMPINLNLTGPNTFAGTSFTVYFRP